jgi:hypothetical protein
MRIFGERERADKKVVEEEEEEEEREDDERGRGDGEEEEEGKREEGKKGEEEEEMAVGVKEGEQLTCSSVVFIKDDIILFKLKFLV